MSKIKNAILDDEFFDAWHAWEIEKALKYLSNDALLEVGQAYYDECTRRMNEKGEPN